MSFAWPWIFLTLPLPWLLRRLLAPSHAGTALRVPHLPDAAAPDMPPRPTRSLWLAALAWLLLVTAAARPQMPADLAWQAVSGRNLLLAFDVSASMGATDLRMNGQAAERLQVARTLADDFIRQREGDRIGLVVFGSQAYLHTPLTFDLEAVRTALAAMESGLAGRETALGDAIALATRHLKNLPGQARVLVLLTDGTNTAGTLVPLRAAWLAQREQVRIHVIGIGAGKDLDEATLKGIAGQTGGIYARATDGVSMTDFLRRLDRAEPIQHGAAGVRGIREAYAWPLGVALALTCWLALRRLREVAA